MKMAKSCQEGAVANRRRSGSEGHRFKTRCQLGLSTMESTLTSTLLRVICIYNYFDVCDVLVDCTFALHVRDVTLAQ